MHRLSLFSFAVFAVFVGTQLSIQFDDRIIGGQNTEIKDHPYQVLVVLSDVGLCGGCIIKKNVVLTAAHCILSNLTAKDYKIQYGVTCIGGTKNWIQAKKLIVNKNYNDTTGDKDSALIILKSAIPLGRNAQIISLATKTPAPGTNAVVSGWGRTGLKANISVILQSVKVQIISREICQKKYSVYNVTITNGMLCAGAPGGGKDACFGDSGGPLVANGKLVGTVSWGHGCGEANYPGVYSNVAKLRQWILKNIS